MEASISFWRAMRCSHHSACSFFACSGHLSSGLAGDFPFFPLLLERRVELLAQRFQRRLELLPDDVDLGVVGDGLERDVRHALIDEALADVAVGRSLDGTECVTSASFELAVLADRRAGSKGSGRP